ncbi:transcriptional regulatory protein GAL4 [Microdochium nivale]|nr:transcriptional regulatory protein GAL4 [Microdochium nivale]
MSSLAASEDVSAGTPASRHPRLPRLPACQSCSARKIKCDSARPACAPCAKNNTECTVADTATGQHFSRAYIHELEQKVYGPPPGLKRPASFPRDAPPAAPDINTPSKAGDTPSVALHGAGLSFMSSLFTDPGWRSTHSDLLQSLTSASQAAAATPSVEPRDLPEFATDAREHFDSYFREDHVQKPILSCADLDSLFNNVYPQGATVMPKQNLTRHTIFRAFMVMAIGTIMPYRRGVCPHHPFGFYLSAMRYFDATFSSSNLSAVQDLLLIARFGIYHHIGTSIWEIVRLCMRMCIEQGLHIKASLNDVRPLEDQIRRRVFWCTYLMDRYSSSTLSRPYAISDCDIEVPLVIDADDPDILVAQQKDLGKTLDELDFGFFNAARSAPSGASVLLLTVRLRQISSEVDSMFSCFSKSKHSGSGIDSPLTATGRICEIMDAIVVRLEAWRGTAPVFEHPRSLYERSEWYDLLKTREIFNTMRKAVDFSPKRDGVPPRYVLTQCLEWAVRIIQLYSDLYDRGIVTYTRSYFQMMINAGFSVLYFASVSVPVVLTPEIAARCRSILSRCGATLMSMTGDLSDARHYVAVFEALHHHLSHKLKIVQSRRPSPPSLRSEAPSEQQIHGHFSGSQSVPLPFAESLASDGTGQVVASSRNHISSGQDAHTDIATLNPPQHVSSHGGMSGFDSQPVWANVQNLPIQEEGQQQQQQHYHNHQYQHQYLNNASASFEADDLAYGMEEPGGTLNWDFLHDEVLWNMGNYVYGDITEAFGVFE